MKRSKFSLFVKRTQAIVHCSTTMNPEHKVGPRAKCDQVCYEAIAKAAEIIVRGRCRCSNGTNATGSSMGGGGGVGVGGHTYQYAGSQNHHPSTSSSNGTRFHLEIEEVPAVRSILQMWQRSLHVPLRLDVYYEYCTDPTNPEQTTRKELLERWCIDYLPSHEQINRCRYGSGSTSSHGHGNYGHGSGSGSNLSPRHNADETISQLRQVVKRVVIQLRVLFSLTRLMPAYRLHHALMDDLQHGNRNHAVTNLNRPLGSGPGLGGGYYQSTNANHSSSGTTMDNVHMQNQDASCRDLVGGQINYSFYVSDTSTSSDQRLSSEAALFSSTTNKPFARHDLDPIPTPFGVLHLTGLFDESLNVENVLMNRARRIMEWNKVNPGTMPISVPSPHMNSNLQQGNNGDLHIPQLRPDGPQPRAAYNSTVDQHYQQQQQYQLQQQQYQHSGNSQSRAIPIRATSNANNIQNNNQGINRASISPQDAASYHHHHHRSHSSEPRSRMNSFKHNSMPDPNRLSASPNVVSEHFHRNNFANVERPKSAGPGQIRDRLSSDPGRGLTNGHGKKKVLSGLSLALMNDESNQSGDQQHQQKHQQQSEGGVPGALSATPPSPLIHPSTSGEDAATLRQRLAFHHPPPSFDEHSLPNNYSVSPSQNALVAQPSALYGYGYNNGHNVIPPANAINVGSLGPSRANSPSPIMPLNTPPQPMFIGSHPRSFGVGGTNNKFSLADQPSSGLASMSKTKQNKDGYYDDNDDDVPFRNPTTLQEAPDDDPGASGSVFSSKLASVQASFQMQSLGNNPPQVQTKDALVLPPLNTLDALHSSPFKMSQSMAPSANGAPLSSSPGGVSMFASLVMGKGSAAYGPMDDGFPLVLASGSVTASSLPSRSNSEHISRSSVGFQFEKEDDYDDMPFAVELDGCGQVSVGGGLTGGSTSKGLRPSGATDFGASSNTSMSSQLVTTLAHRCSTGGRLKLFGNGGELQNVEGSAAASTVLERSIVEDQLNEFRSFGDSITASGLLSPTTR